MIHTEGAVKTFGPLTAVDGASLDVGDKDIFGLVGPDGAGKTTLMRMICGLIRPDGGRIGVFGQNPGTRNFPRQDLGYMPQRFSLYGELTIMENIHFFGAMYGLDRKVIDRRADEILEMTNLIEFKSRFADNLSGGMKQKLALTCALITRPRLLVLDEPTYGVDPESRKEFWKILYRLNKDGMTIMVSTPYMDEAELCSMVAFMIEGRIAAIDSPVSLKRNFSHQLLEVKTRTKDPDLFADFTNAADVSFYGDKYHLAVEDAEAAGVQVAAYLKNLGVDDAAMRVVAPSMEDVFVALTRNGVN